jgi:membrane protease YdiL (CAAX protease family)
MQDEDRKRSLHAAATYTVLVLGLACLYWAMIAAAQAGRLPFAVKQFDFSMQGNSVPGVVLTLALRLFGPLLCAALTVAFFRGRDGLKRWALSMVEWRVPGRLYLLAFFAPLAVSAVIVAVGVPLGAMRFVPAQVHLLQFSMFFVVMMIMDGPLGEEPGWRGLLLPELMGRYSMLTASLVVGVIWFIWHMPLYLADGKSLHPIGFFINVVCQSVIFTWFYLRARQSTFFMIFLHNTSNFALFLLLKSFELPQGVGPIQVIYDVILVLAAIAAAMTMKRGVPPAAAAA